jgi:hypothetical protein
VIVRGSYRREEGDDTLIVEDMRELVQEKSKRPHKLIITGTPASLSDRTLLEDFRLTLAQYPGRTQVELHLFEPATSQTTVAVLPEQVNAENEGLQTRLRTLFGEAAIQVAS